MCRATSGPRARRWPQPSELAGCCFPDVLVDRVALAKLHADHGSPTLDQLAFADFVERGGSIVICGRCDLSTAGAGMRWSRR